MPHLTTSRVLYGDTDAAGVVYYANYLRYFEIGRTEWMRCQGRTYRELEKEGLILPVIECGCRYKKPARYDDLLTIETILVEARSVCCRFNYRILRREEDDARPVLLARGFTSHAPVDRDGRLARFPAELLAELRGSLTEPADK